jgi:hypothetical protein
MTSIPLSSRGQSAALGLDTSENSQALLQEGVEATTLLHAPKAKVEVAVCIRMFRSMQSIRHLFVERQTMA